jgi:5'-nucleotidase
MNERWSIGCVALLSLLVGGCGSSTTDEVRAGQSAGDPAAAAAEDMDEPQGTVPPGRAIDGPMGEARGQDDLQILTISDWHGQLDPNGTVGGAAVLSTYFKQARAAVPRTLTLTAGDAFGATPPLSGLFGDVPAIKAMRLMGIQADTFGNHNFDAGIAHLQTLIDLAASTTEAGSPFPYVSSNLTGLNDNLTGVSNPYAIVDVGGIKVGLVGITNDDAPTLLFPGRLGSMTVAPSIDAANAAAHEAKKNGAEVVVVLVHMGATGVDASGAPVGPLIDFAKGLEGADVVVGDHTDIQVGLTMGKVSGGPAGLLVVENRSKGVTFAKLHFRIAGGAVLASSAEFVSPTITGVTPDPAIVSMLAPYRSALSGVYDTKIAVATGTFKRGSNIERLGEVPIGDLIADSIRLRYGTQVAFVNGGGIRAPLPSTYAPADHTLRRPAAGYAAGPPWDLVQGDIYATLPFGNIVSTRSVTGAQLWGVCERSVGSLPLAFGGFMQISGYKITYKVTNPAGSRCQSLTLDDGTAIVNDTAHTYTAATSDFTNAGGDGYTMLADGQGITREVMADVLLEYVKSLGTLTPTTSGRIVNVP